MSTNKTQNYSLHAWVKDDKFLMDEVNENFTAIDTKLHEEVDVLDRLLKAETQARTQQLGAKADSATVSALEQTVRGLGKWVTGTYTGTGQGNQTIDLEAPILAIYIECCDGRRPSNGSGYVQGGLAMPNFPIEGGAAYVDGSSFTVCATTANTLWIMNRANQVFYYIALLQQ